MKIISMIIAALMFLPVFASAVPDSVITGPYNVSFDFGFPKYAYDVKIEAPEHKERLSGEISTQYIVDITNKTGIARTMRILLEYSENNDTILTSDDLKQLISLIFEDLENTYNIDVAARIIDGSEGAIGSAEMDYKGFKAPNYYATFYPVIDRYHLKCVIFSSFPWDEGTLSFLKTVHIEKINATS
jgi:hypothetical protein